MVEVGPFTTGFSINHYNPLVARSLKDLGLLRNHFPDAIMAISNYQSLVIGLKK